MMLDKEKVLKQFKKDIEDIENNDSKKLFYTIIYNIMKRSLGDDIVIYNSDYIL